MSNNEFDSMIDEVNEDVVTQLEDIENLPPSENDPEWSEWILDQLDDSELFNGAPKTDGLRRVLNKHYGDIVNSQNIKLTEYCDPRDGNLVHCSATHLLEVIRHRDEQRIVVTGSVNAITNKTKAPFCNHLVSTIDTKAEGKAIRRMLKLRVLTAEEMPDPQEDDATGSEPINDQQITAINMMCKRLNVNVQKLMVQLSGNKKLKSINEASYLHAVNAIGALSGYQRKKDTTPEEVIGYDSNWRDNFSN